MCKVVVGNELGIAPLKLESKWSTKEVEEIVRKVNELLYFFRWCLITPKVKTFIDGRLVKYCNEAQAIPISQGDQKVKKRNELVSKLMALQVRLSSYQPDNDPTADERACKYQVGAYLRQKDGMTTEDRLALIRKFKVFSTFYKPTTSLQSVQRELLDAFVI